MLIEVKRRTTGKVLFINPRNIAELDGPDVDAEEQGAIYTIVRMNDGREFHVEGNYTALAAKIGKVA